MKSVFLASTLAIVASAADAATVGFTEGRVHLTLHPFITDGPGGEPIPPETALYDVNHNEVRTRSLTGHEGAGLAEVEYAAFDTDEGAAFEARVFAASGGAENNGETALSVFEITFSVVEETAYRLEAEVGSGAFDFKALLNDEEASASVDGLGNHEGTLPTIDDDNGIPIGFGTYVSAGFLSAGTHTFTVTAIGGLGGGMEGLSTEGFARLTLGEAPTLIPTPAASLLGLAVLGGHAFRRRRRLI